MSTVIVDKRSNDKGKATGNKKKFIKRVEEQIRRALPDIIEKSGIKDITTSKDGIKVPIRDTSEPTFIYDKDTGTRKSVHPGNIDNIEGDEIYKPRGSGKGPKGRKGSNDPSITEDDFVITISREEFLKYFFDDLELPDLVRERLNTIVEYKMRRAGYIQYGAPSKLNVLKSYMNSLSRKISLCAYYDKRIKELEDLLDAVHDLHKRVAYLDEISKLKKLKATVPFFDDIDLRYNNHEKVPHPTKSAVMFCIMDVSGSMGEIEKDLAKRFFTLLYIFLTREYDKIDLVFIRHHTEAKEVTEEEFFNSQESGGTMVAPALRLCKKIMDERYSDPGWNKYVVECSDGDTWSYTDANECALILRDEILPNIQFMAYIEVARDAMGDLWYAYNELSKKSENFCIKQVRQVSEIWEVFRSIFQKTS